MVDFKSWNMKHLSGFIILSIIIIAIIMLFHLIVVPILGNVSVLFATFSLTDTLLLLILLRLLVK